MAAVAEKARFYLERAVPLLRELEEREIFTKVSSVPPPFQLLQPQTKLTPHFPSTPSPA